MDINLVSHSEVTKQKKLRVFLLFLLYDGRIRILTVQIMMDLDPFVFGPNPDPSLFARIRILPSSSKNSKKDLDLLCLK